MDYKKGIEVLPARLLQEIQEYVEGSLVYIPKKSNKAGWGSISGARRSIDQRNRTMIHLFGQGTSTAELSEMFHLEEDTIRKIVYGKKQL